MARAKPKRRKRKKKGRRRPDSGSPPPTKRRARWPLVLAVIVGAVALYVYDYRGPLETIPGDVLSTRTYPHRTATEPPHTHTEAVIEFEGKRHTAAQADGVEEGDQVRVLVRRGRLTGRPRFVDLRATGSRSP